MATVTLTQDLPRFDVECYAGRPLEITISLLDGSGDPLDALAVASARAHVRLEPDSEAVLHEWSTEEDPPDIVVSDGELVLTATAETTSGWAELWPHSRPGITTAWWDVEITDGEGETWQVTAPGTLTVIHQVTR